MILHQTDTTIPTSLTVPEYNGQQVPLPAATANNASAVAKAQQVLDSLPQGNYLPSDLEMIAGLAATGAAIGGAIGAGSSAGILGVPAAIVGAIIGTILGVLVEVLPGIFGFIADCDASQNAENALGKVIQQIQGSTTAADTVASANASMVSALDKLVQQDFKNPSTNWPIFFQQNGNPGSITIQRESECGPNWGIRCVLYTILHTRPKCSVSTAAHKVYVEMVHEAITNVAHYLTGMGNTALANEISTENVSLAIIGGGVNLSDILNATKPASSSTSSVGSVVKSAVAGFATPGGIVLGLLVLGVIVGEKKERERK